MAGRLALSYLRANKKNATEKKQRRRAADVSFPPFGAITKEFLLEDYDDDDDDYDSNDADHDDNSSDDSASDDGNNENDGHDMQIGSIDSDGNDILGAAEAEAQRNGKRPRIAPSNRDGDTSVMERWKNGSK